MTSETTTIAVRVTSELKARLDAIARNRRMTTGDPVRMADVVRDALEQFTRREDAATTRKEEDE